MAAMGVVGKQEQGGSAGHADAALERARLWLRDHEESDKADLRRADGGASLPALGSALLLSPDNNNDGDDNGNAASLPAPLRAPSLPDYLATPVPSSPARSVSSITSFDTDSLSFSPFFSDGSNLDNSIASLCSLSSSSSSSSSGFGLEALPPPAVPFLAPHPPKGKAGKRTDTRRLKAYLRALQESVDSNSIHAQQCELAEREVRQRTAHHTKRLREHEQHALVAVYRNAQHAKLARFANQHDLALRCVVLVKTRMAEVHALVDDPLGLCGAVDDAFFQTAKELCGGDGEVAAMVAADRVLLDELARREEVYAEMTKVVKEVERSATRSAQLHSLLEDAKVEWSDSGVSYHKYQAHDQQLFDALVLDSAHSEGLMIRHALDAVVVDRKGDATDQVPALIAHLVHVIAERHGVASALVPVLRLYVSRAVFPRLAGVLFERCSEKEKDARFRAQQKWMRKLSDTELGVPDKFACGEGHAEYHAASAALEDLCFHVVPLDMLHCIREGAKQMLAQARRVSDEPDARVGADAFFPIIVYTTVVADLPDVHTVLRFLNRFASDQEKRVEVGYFLTCLEGAALYITNTSPDEVSR